MATGGSRKAIIAAIVGNFAIAVTKFIAGLVTGSSAMFSEAIHSIVDTGNGGLMMLGIHRGRKPADPTHPFGHGKELYFWTFVVAILIFALGGGISIYEGIIHLQHPRPLENPLWNYLVLGVALVFEGITWVIALREFRRVKGEQGYFQAVHASKDPTTFTVLFEDSAALLGLVFAFAGIFLGHQLGIPELDGAASIAIGLLLATVAVLLARESKGLLIGEAIDPDTREKIRRRVEADPAVVRLARALTMHFGPRDVLLTMEVEFQPVLSAGEVAQAVERLDRQIRDEVPMVKHTFVEARSIAKQQKEKPRPI